MTEAAKSSFAYVTYIRTTQEELWAALTTPEFMKKYWFGMNFETDWKAGSPWKLRVQLPARDGAAVARRREVCRRDILALDTRRAYYLRSRERDRRGDVHARAAGHEHICPRGRRRLPRLFYLCARAGQSLGRVSVARPRPQGTQRGGRLVAPP
jgi:hypothetical protein